MEQKERGYNVRAFGIAREIIGERQYFVATDGRTVGELRTLLMLKFPQLTTLRSLMVAVNNVYASDDQPLTAGDEIALIPPVSGG